MRKRLKGWRLRWKPSSKLSARSFSCSVHPSSIAHWPLLGQVRTRGKASRWI